MKEQIEEVLSLLATTTDKVKTTQLAVDIERAYWLVDNLLTMWERQNGEPQGDYRVTAEGDRVWAIGGFISYD